MQRLFMDADTSGLMKAAKGMPRRRFSEKGFFHHVVA